MQSSKKILSFGEIVWDVFCDKKTLGGAPLNFVYYCLKNGFDARIASAIGADKLGEETLNAMRELKIDCGLVDVLKDYPTGIVNVAINSLGIASYEICSPSAWDYISASAQALEFAKGCDAFVFGSLGRRGIVSEASFAKFLAVLPDECLKVFDINLRGNFYTKDLIFNSMKVANLVKLNDDELVEISKMFGLCGCEETMAQALFEMFNLDYLVLTLGARGHLAISKEGVYKRKAETVKVVDTVGAGDSFTVTFLCEILNKKSLAEASNLAAIQAAEVCGHKGALV